MKKAIVTLVFATLLSVSGYSQFNFGAGLSLALDNDSALGLQGKTLIGINDRYSGTVDATLWLSDGADYTINTNVMYNLFDIGQSFDLRPTAGLNFTRGGSELELGINLGVNMFLKFDKYDIYLEPKFVLLGVYDGLVISAGILF